MLYFVNSDHLVEDNAFFVLRHAMVLEGGGSGNVFGYNDSTASQGNVGDGWLFPDMITHGAHPYMNLFEGNIGVKLNFDNYWGSSSHNTAFRNWIERRSDPPDETVRYALRAVVLDAFTTRASRPFSLQPTRGPASAPIVRPASASCPPAAAARAARCCLSL
jgi:hypothetical protein